MAIYALGDDVPRIHPTAFVHPDATVIGDVEIGEDSSVWPQAVLRGDNGGIRIGARTSIQDGSVLHTTPMWETSVGDECVIGHIVHLEGCTIEDHSLIGSGSVVLHRAVVRSHSLVGANAVVTDDTEVPTGAMALGVPAKIVPGRVAEGSFAGHVAVYVARARQYRTELRRID